MTTYYLVVHKDFEYNDEYHENHDGYKIDSKLIKSKEEANKIAEKKNKKAVKEEWYTDSDGNAMEPYKVIEISE